MSYGWKFVTLYRRQVSRPSPRKSKMAVWGGLTNSCEKKGSEKQRRKGKIYPCEKLIAAATAAKSLQSCPTPCDPTDGSPPGSPVPGTLQESTLEWVATEKLIRIWQLSILEMTGRREENTILAFFLKRNKQTMFHCLTFVLRNIFKYHITYVRHMILMTSQKFYGWQ